MKSTIREINAMVERARSGEPLGLPEGKTEQCLNDPHVPGLYLRARERRAGKGRADWFVYWKIFRQKKTHSIGNAAIYDRKAAVEAARDVLADIRRGQFDPHKVRAERVAASKVIFRDIAKLFVADCRERNEKEGRPRKGTINIWERTLGVVERPHMSDARQQIKYVEYLQPLHNRPLADITTDEVQALIDQIAVRCGKQIARSCRTAAKQLFKWAGDRSRYLPSARANPIFLVKPPKLSELRDRVMTDDEIRLIWKTCEKWEADILRYPESKARKRGYKVYLGLPGNITRPRIVMLALLTGMRRQELAELQWRELHLEGGNPAGKYVHIPKERIKTGHDLCLPLGDWTVELLRKNLPEREDGYVFPTCLSPRDSKLPASRNVSSTDALVDKRIKRAGNVPPPDWTFHDLRRTFRSLLSVLKVSFDTGEALINHHGHRSRIGRNYDPFENWEDKRIAIAKLEDRMCAIVEGTAPKIAVSPRWGQRSIRR